MINRSYINKNVTVIIRTVGERTTGLCHELIKKQIAEENIHIISETPFTEAVRKTFEVGLRENRKWTFVVDADVLIRPGVIDEIVEYAETVDENVFEIEGKIIDKFVFSLNPREAGNHLYRTVYMNKALEFIPDPLQSIRPETHVKDAMKTIGYPWQVIDLFIGYHDYEQFYSDIYRKCFIQAKKHNGYVLQLLPKWKKLSESDADFLIAAAGFEAGNKWQGQVAIDKNSDFTVEFEEIMKAYSIEEKCGSVDYSKVEGFLITADEYLKYKKTRKASVVIYTAISGGFDDLIQHKYISKDFDYVCYTDTPIEDPGIWEIRSLEDRGLDSNRNAKYYKIFPHEIFPEYEYSIWIDGNIDVLNDDLERRVYELINHNNLISANVHFERSCIYQEGNICMAYSIDDPGIIKKQMDYLASSGFPKNYGLFEMNLIFRIHNNPVIITLMNDWWEMIIRFSKRDQLSFMYALWKNDLSCEKMYEQSHRKKAGFFFTPHYKIVYSSLYVDSGKGFNESELLVEKIILKSGCLFKITFDLSSYSKIESLRFDPIEGNFCALKINGINIKHSNNEKTLTCDEIKKIINSNGIINDSGEILFYTTDPQVVLSFSGEIKSISIEGELRIMVFDEVIAAMTNSYAMKLGKMITWLPKKVLNYLKRIFNF